MCRWWRLSVFFRIGRERFCPKTQLQQLDSFPHVSFSKLTLGRGDALWYSTVTMYLHFYLLISGRREGSSAAGTTEPPLGWGVLGNERLRPAAFVTICSHAWEKLHKQWDDTDANRDWAMQRAAAWLTLHHTIFNIRGAKDPSTFHRPLWCRVKFIRFHIL